MCRAFDAVWRVNPGGFVVNPGGVVVKRERHTWQADGKETAGLHKAGAPLRSFPLICFALLSLSLYRLFFSVPSRLFFSIGKGGRTAAELHEGRKGGR